MRGDRAALRACLLRTWKAFLTRCCSRVVFDLPVLPFEVCTRALPDPAITSASQHHLQSLQTSTLIQIEAFVLVFSVMSISPKFSSVKLRSVFCAVVMSTCLRVRATVGKQQLCTCRARERCQYLTITMKHGVPTMWTTTTQSWPLTWQHEHFLTTCWTSPTSRRSLPKTSASCVGMHRKLGCRTM